MGEDGAELNLKHGPFSPFVPSEVEGREAGRKRVSTSLDTNGIGMIARQVRGEE